MSFTLGKREKILLLVLVLVVLWILSVKFMLMPMSQAYQANQDALTQLETKKTEMNTLMLENKNMDSKITEAANNAQEASNRFFPPFENEQMDLWIYDYTEKAGLRNLSVDISERGAAQISTYSDVVPELRIALSDLVSQINAQPILIGASAVAAEEDAAKFVFVNTVTVKADCYYENLLYFSDLIINSGRTVHISSISMKPRQDDSGVKGVLTAQITMQVYSVPKFYADDIMDISFDTPKGKDKLM